MLRIVLAACAISLCSGLPLLAAEKTAAKTADCKCSDCKCTDCKCTAAKSSGKKTADCKCGECKCTECKCTKSAASKDEDKPFARDYKGEIQQMKKVLGINIFANTAFDGVAMTDCPCAATSNQDCASTSHKFTVQLDMPRVSSPTYGCVPCDSSVCSFFHLSVPHCTCSECAAATTAANPLRQPGMACCGDSVEEDVLAFLRATAKYSPDEIRKLGMGFSPEAESLHSQFHKVIQAAVKSVTNNCANLDAIAQECENSLRERAHRQCAALSDAPAWVASQCAGQQYADAKCCSSYCSPTVTSAPASPPLPSDACWTPHPFCAVPGPVFAVPAGFPPMPCFAPLSVAAGIHQWRLLGAVGT